VGLVPGDEGMATNQINQIAPPPPPPGVTFVESPPPPPKGIQFKEDAEPSSWSEKLGMKGPAFDYNPVKAAVDLTEGAWSGAASTAFNSGNLVRSAIGKKPVSAEDPVWKSALRTPPSIPGQIGKYGEQAAEFAIPLSGVAKAAKALRLAGRMAAEGAASGGIAALQSGGDPATTATAATIGAIAPAIGPGIRAGRTAMKGAMLSGTSWKDAITKGLRPASRNLKFEADIPLAMRDIKTAETQTGQVISESDNPLKAFIDNVKAAKRTVWNEYETLLGPQAGRGINLSPVADAKIASIPTKTKLMDPEGYQRLVDEANKYRRTFKMKEAEDFLQTTNDELESYFAKYPHMRRSAVGKNPETAALVAEGDSLRNAIYSELDSTTHGSVPRAIKQRYGALMDMLGEAERRYNVAARQSVNSLSEQVGGWRTAGLLARGLVRGATKDLPGAAMDFTEALATREIARALKEANTSAELIRHAFKQYRVMPNPATGIVPAALTPVAPGPYVAPGAFNVPPKPPAIPPVVGPAPLVRVGSPTAPYVAPGAVNRPPTPPAQPPVVGQRPAVVINSQRPAPLVAPGISGQLRSPDPIGRPPTSTQSVPVPVEVGDSPASVVGTPAAPEPLIGSSPARSLRPIDYRPPPPGMTPPPARPAPLTSAPLEAPAPAQAPLPTPPPVVATRPAAAKAGGDPAQGPPPSPGPVKLLASFSNPVGRYEQLGEATPAGVPYRFIGPEGKVYEGMMLKAKWDDLVAKGNSVVAAQPPLMAPGPIMQ
jgi:hypothetical protein